ncbi:phage tail tape measure protein [Pectobacterium aroidearum]|uniref:Phage tail tape measure protein n=1 Tax=Pectobacterium aroidearum TaxID=1201031 RepID=A0ABR5Z881_9GAMM|nr:phage tail tape measure protein [Pectobacterium aroidearum]MBA5197939.1 phage tail tape measure protein [Pectobacterium aroidearum]MBA5230732.1 phage tail tape measure protein [Pectobacterium aroidearum]
MTNLDIRVAFSAIDKFTRPVNAARNSSGSLSESIKKTQAAIKSLESQSSSFQKLRNSTNDTAQKLSNAQREAAGLSQRLKETGTLSDAQRAKLDGLRTKITTLSTAYSTQSAKLRDVGQALRQHGVTLTSGSGTIQSAIRRTEQYSQSLERERRQLAAVTQARARYDQAHQTAGNLRSSGTGATVGAAAAGYAGGRFLAPAVGFDEEMSRVQALTRLDKGDAQMGALRAQAKKLGAETAFTTRDAASGQAFLAMAGFTPQSIQAALPGVLNMALAGGMELGESADIGSNILSQFSLDASQMDRVSDTLTAAFTRTNTDLRNLGDTMKYAGPVASKLGISLEDAAAMAGMLANNGIRGSDAGTAMRASLSRLASPPKAASEALKELGVSVADANGKMRPMQDVLLDLYKATKKYGDVDQVSFFKDIAGEEAFVGLQTLVQAAGSGALGKLAGELKNASGEANAVAKKMADNLGGDLKELDSAWEGFRIQIAETINGPLRQLTQSLTSVINSMMEWAKENPKLTQTILLVGGGALALVAVIGATSLAMGILMGPLAKLQLGFTLLTGGKGIGGTIAMFRTLGGVAGGSMARVGGWSQVITSLSGGFSRLPVLLAPLRGMLFSAFTSPLSALTSLGKGIGSLLLRLTGLPALWSMISGAVSILGGALSLLLSPIGLIGAAFVAVGVLIWKYWEPIKAFFSGMFSGIMESLAPLRAAFSQTFAKFSPIFDAIGTAVSNVVNWFKNLLTPMESSKETLDKCSSAGEIFGKVLGGALNLVLTPAKMLLDTLAWILEKLGVLPDEAEKARKKIEDAQRLALLNDKAAFLQGFVASVTTKNDNGNNPFVGPLLPPGYTPPQPLTGDSGTQRRLQKISDNTSGLLDETKKRIGPGDIVFKNLPRAFALQGAFQETRIATQKVPRVVSQQIQDITAPPIRQSATVPVSATGAGPSFNLTFNDVGKQDPRELAQLVEQKIRQVLNEKERNRRGSFRDQD